MFAICVVFLLIKQGALFFENLQVEEILPAKELVYLFWLGA